MSVSSEIMEFMKQTLLPEISGIKAELSEFKVEMREELGSFKLEMREELAAFKVEMREELSGIKGELKVIKGRLDLMDKRFDEAQDQRNGLREDLREVRSYVWTGGLNTAHGTVAESQAQYRTKRES